MSLLLLNQEHNIEKGQSYTWSILGPFEKALNYAWTIFQAIEAPLSYSWSVHVFIEKALSFSWTIFEAVERPLVYSWRSMGFFLSSRILYHFRSKRRIKTFRRQPPGREDFK